MDFRAAAFAAMAAALYDHFPDARRIYLNAPPPFGDRTHVERHPGKLGGENPPPVAPDDLRMTLYRMQTDSYRRIAEKLGAAFVTPAPETLDDRGFLASGFYAADPTHGNAAYGKVMLDAILRQAEAA